MSAGPAPTSIVRPGASPSGPPGWEASRQQHIAEEHHLDEETQRQGNDGHSHGSGFKDKLHKVGEKLALVPPKDAEGGAAVQDASTNPQE